MDMENTQSETGSVKSAQPETADTSLFTVGSVLSIAWKTLFKSPIVFFGLTVLVFVLAQITIRGILFTMSGVSPGVSQGRIIFFASLTHLVPMLLGLWIAGTIAYGVFQTLKGNRASLVASLYHGMRHFVPLICVGLLYTFGIGLLVVLGALMGPPGFLMVPIIIIMMCSWEVAAPACVIERLGPAKSMSRSSELTDGCRMKILGLIIIVRITTWVVQRIASHAMPTELETTVFRYIPLLAGSITTAFGYVVTAVVYYELRRIKEGVNIDSLANVFD